MTAEMEAPTPKFSLDNIDGRFLHRLDEILSVAMKSLKLNPFAQKKSAIEIGSVGISLSSELESAEKDVRSIGNSDKLFDMLGVPYTYQSDLFDEAQFKMTTLAEDGAHFVGSFRVKDYERTGNESYCAIDLVVLIDSNGELMAVPLVKKAIIAGGGMVPGALEKTTEKRVNKLAELKSLGIPVINIYGSDPQKACIYEGLYNDKREEMFAQIKRGDVDSLKYLDQLVKIASILDSHRFASLNFLSDIIFDGGEFLFLDAGADVGTAGSAKVGTPSLDILLSTFPKQGDYIKQAYWNETQIPFVGHDTREQISGALEL